METIVVQGGAGKIKNKKAYKKGVKEALRIGYEVLKREGALEAVTRAVVAMEDNPTFNCGTGSSLTIDGKVEMDASVMMDDGSFGAVGCIEDVKNPILVARKVMEETDHLLLAGEGALRFARFMGFEPYNPITERRKKLLEEMKGEEKHHYLPKFKRFIRDFGTVGAVALDREGRIAAATSSGGLIGKLPGRVGDSAIIGAGTYASTYGGASATGHGECIIRLFIAKRAIEIMKDRKAEEAIKVVINEATKYGCKCGLVGIDCSGNIGFGFNTQSMAFGYVKDGRIYI